MEGRGYHAPLSKVSCLIYTSLYLSRSSCTYTLYFGVKSAKFLFSPTCLSVHTQTLCGWEVYLTKIRHCQVRCDEGVGDYARKWVL